MAGAAGSRVLFLIKWINAMYKARDLGLGVSVCERV